MPMPNRQMVGGELYRYGYQGEFAETDSETGKPAFQLRIYDPRIGRWTSPDPMGQHFSPYLSMSNNWISRVDPDGGCDKENCSCGGHVQLDEVWITGKGRGGAGYSGMDWSFFNNLPKHWDFDLKMANLGDYQNMYRNQHKAQQTFGKQFLPYMFGPWAVAGGLAAAPYIAAEGALIATYGPKVVGAAAMSNLSINTGRQAFVNGAGNLFGQATFNIATGGGIGDIDYFDTLMASSTGGLTSIILQSGINGTLYETKLNRNFMIDLSSKVLVGNVHSKLLIPRNSFLGDRGMFSAFDMYSRTGTTSFFMGVSSQFK